MRCPITYAKIANEIHKTAALLGLPLILTAGCLRTQEKIPLVERIRYVE